MKAGQAGSCHGLPWPSRRPSDLYIKLVCRAKSAENLKMFHLDDALQCSTVAVLFAGMAISYSLIMVSLICNSASWFLNEGLN